MNQDQYLESKMQVLYDSAYIFLNGACESLALPSTFH